ncbi:hypothetical protein CEXT_263481 [Caerostris extrusa]|uniref:Uncharacterized protein n=1 Tax=Caerostris extrusa TaxID=172846 RepID=A0AAV4SD06_CAEEX|nr:hypothetical protein CEXT_263481 [Caerostris extrusa]
MKLVALGQDGIKTKDCLVNFEWTHREGLSVKRRGLLDGGHGKSNGKRNWFHCDAPEIRFESNANAKSGIEISLLLFSLVCISIYSVYINWWVTSRVIFIIRLRKKFCQKK